MAHKLTNKAHRGSEPFPEEDIQKGLAAILGETTPASSLKRILVDETDDETANFACHQWVANYVRDIGDEGAMDGLAAMRDRFGQMLDRADLLTKYGDNERLQLEDRLSNLVEQIGYYLTAVKTIADGGGNA